MGSFEVMNRTIDIAQPRWRVTRWPRNRPTF